MSLGQFAALDSEPKEIVKEFRVTKDAVLPVGTKLLPTHFVVGQFVDVKGKSKVRFNGSEIELTDHRVKEPLVL